MVEEPRPPQPANRTVATTARDIGRRRSARMDDDLVAVGSSHFPLALKFVAIPKIR
jgi:hypothetical protein